MIERDYIPSDVQGHCEAIFKKSQDVVHMASDGARIGGLVVFHIFTRNDTYF